MDRFNHYGYLLNFMIAMDTNYFSQIAVFLHHDLKNLLIKTLTEREIEFLFRNLSCLFLLVQIINN